MITSEFPPYSGGVGYYVYNLSKRLVESNNNVTIITCKRNSNQMYQEFVEGICIRRVPFYPIYPFHSLLLKFSINRLFKLLENNFEIVHVHSPMPLLVKTSLPIITTVHTPMLIDSRYHEIFDFKSLFEKVQSSIIYPPMESDLFRSSTKITTVSQTVALELREYGLDTSKIIVVKNGVNSQTFLPCKKRDSAEEYILFTGVLRARKGLFDLIRSASYVCKIKPSTKFIICGKGPFRKKMENEVKKLGLEKQVIFLGYVSRNELIHIFQNATLQVIPSHYEGMPNTLLEGMSCGLPIVATDIGGNNEVIVSGINGFLVPPKSPQIMAEVILKLLNDSTLRKEIGEKARSTIEKYYTWDKIADNILEVYKKIGVGTSF